MAPHEQERAGDQDLTYCTYVLYLYIYMSTIGRGEVPCVVRRGGRGHDGTFLFAPATPQIMGGTTNEWGFPHSTRSLFQVGTFWLPDDFSDGGGTTVPLSGGLIGL